MVSVEQTVAAPGRYRILGHPTDLAGHVAALGPLPVSTSPGREWREAFVGSLEASGLTGRGGAGFPAAIKAAMTRAAGSGGTILVNAMEGEPASDKDKLLLIRSPHVVLDGAQLLAAATGASQVTVCVPAGREAVAAATAHALAERTAAGWTPWPSNWCVRLTVSSPARSRRWCSGSSAVGPSRRSDPTKGRPCGLGAGRR